MKLILVVLATVYFKASFQEEKSREQLEDLDKDEYPRKPVFYAGFPYLAFLKFGKGYYCAGTLISHRYVLTAAHCVLDHTGTVYNSSKVYLGWDTETFELVVEIEQINPFHKGEKRNGRNEHGQYKNYDIALIKLAKYVEFSRLIKPAALPAASDYITQEQYGTLAGWHANHKLIRIIPTVRMNRVAEDINCLPDKYDGKLFKCLYKFFDKVNMYFGKKDYDPDSTICTRSNDDGQDCAGTDGGPLMIDNKLQGVSMATTKWKDIGESEINGTCITNGDYSTFTKVTSFLPWIEKNSDIQIERYLDKNIINE